MDDQDNKQQPSFPGLDPAPMSGVIHVLQRASEFGYGSDPEWANFGRGEPEVGPLDGAEAWIDIQATLGEKYDAYGPVSGIPAFREAIANLYNELHRKGKKSQYTAANVSVVAGGRLALTRILSSIGAVNFGHCSPDYPGYEDLLATFHSFIPVGHFLNSEQQYHFTAAGFRQMIEDHDLKGMLISNPCNPTGQVLFEDELKGWTQAARDTNCLTIFDEFYSSYIYDQSTDDGSVLINSASKYIDDIEKDPVIIVDGLTKNWRRPGWRVCWILGPTEVVRAMANAGSFLDGGAPHPLQQAAIPLLDPDFVRGQAKDIQKIFGKKRDCIIKGLEEMGIRVPFKPQGSFYCWADLRELPDPLNNSIQFFEEGLKEKVITVPGVYFDIHPAEKRQDRYESYCRISFGPDMATIERGLAALKRVIEKHH